jgi:hypothetical protein
MNYVKTVGILGILIFGTAIACTGCSKPDAPATNVEQGTQDGAVGLAGDTTPTSASDASEAPDASLATDSALADAATATDH